MTFWEATVRRLEMIGRLQLEEFLKISARNTKVGVFQKYFDKPLQILSLWERSHHFPSLS